MKSTGTLYIRLAEGCGPCIEFKNTSLPAFEKFLVDNGVTHQVFHLARVDEMINGGPDVLNEVGWTPSFIWVPIGQEGNVSKAKVYNGHWIDGTQRWIPKKPHEDPDGGYNVSDLHRWLIRIGAIGSNTFKASAAPTRPARPPGQFQNPYQRY